MVISLLDDLTKLRNTFLANSRSISLLFSEDCANNDIKAPSSSRHITVDIISNIL